MDIKAFILGYKKGFLSAGSNAPVSPVHTVTFMNDDGTAVLYKRSVVDGDDCADVVQKKLLAQPTKEDTAQYDYTYSGWSLTPGGNASSSALANVTGDRTVYAAFTSELKYYTISYFDEDGTLFTTEYLAYGKIPSYVPVKDGYSFQYWTPEVKQVTGNASYYATFKEERTLAGSTWEKISEISEAGLAENYFAIGDKKQVDIIGTIGTSEVNQTNYAVYIIGFDHNSEFEGTGIHFGTFKYKSYDLDYALGVNLNDSTSDGTKNFNMNHRTSATVGGWAGCDLRYDILGSTDVAPNCYNSSVVTGKAGYDATETCATNPVENTLMAALPADLRAVMKPMIKYTDNVAGTSISAANVTATIDYLPLLSEYEVFGAQKNANPGEKDKQARYAYFAAGKTAKKHVGSGYNNWWLRSPKLSASQFCVVSSSGTIAQINTSYSYGIAPIFKV